VRGDCVVVGGCGFLGRAVARQLAAKGAAVTVIDLPQAAAAAAQNGMVCHAADIRDRDSLLRLAAHCPRGAWVINLAARQYQDAVPKRGRQRWFCEVNVDGALNVGHFARALGAAGLVQFSTDMVYGAPRAMPVGEDHPRAPIGEYGRSKAMMERNMREFARVNGLPLTVFRPRLIAGAGRLGVFASLFALIRRHLPLPLIGGGRNHYQMVAVEDCADAVVRALAAGCPNAVYNLGSQPSLCVRDLMRQLCRAVGSKSPVVPTPAPLVRATLRALARIGIEPLYLEQYQLADKHFIAATENARRDLGWRPQRDDLSMLVEAYRHWRAISA